MEHGAGVPGHRVRADDATVVGRSICTQACADGLEIDAHPIECDRSFPGFGQFGAQEARSRIRHGIRHGIA